jgi:hypothetical protein
MMDHDNGYRADRRVTARCALALSVFGPVFLVVMNLLGHGMYSSDVPLDPFVSVALVAEFFALALGFLGRQRISGKAAVIVSLIVLVCAFLIPVLG